MNRKWLEDVYRVEAVTPFLRREICCVGTTRGARAAMQNYFGLMAAEFDRLAQTGLRPFWAGIRPRITFWPILASLPIAVFILRVRGSCKPLTMKDDFALIAQVGC